MWIAFLSSLLLLPQSSADDRAGFALKGENYEQVTLKDLPESGDRLDGKYFRIVRGREDEAVPMNLPRAQWHRNANALYHQNVYYHLTLARDYFVREHGMTELQSDAPLVVRLDIEDDFIESGHFAPSEGEPCTSDSVTVPPSKPNRLYPGVKPWGVEIWFCPPKWKKAHSSFELGARQINSRGFKSQMHLQTLKADAIEGGYEKVGGGRILWRSHVEDILLGLALWEGVPAAVQGVSRLFSGKDYVDLASVAPVIYHEYSHAVLSKHLFLSKRPVTEGYADYFAAVISGMEKFAFSAGQYSESGDGKNAKESSRYDPAFERYRFSTASFLLSALWTLRRELGPQIVDRAVMKSHEYLDGRPDMHGDVVRALRRAFHALYPRDDARAYTGKMLTVLRDKKGF